MKISTQNLSSLPNILNLKKLCQSLALLDAILMPEWEYRYYSFNSQWDVSKTEDMASMRTGQGNHYFILFCSAGTIMKGFVKESVIDQQVLQSGKPLESILESVPPVFNSFLQEPAFDIKQTTFCIWRQSNDLSWQTSALPALEEDGSAKLLQIFDNNPTTYQEWASAYYEKEVDLKVVTHIYHHELLTQSVIEKLNPETNLESLKEDLAEIGYSCA